MLFSSITFIVFFCVVLALYWTLSDRFRRLLLLLASYYFYASWSANFALLLFCTSAVTYGGVILSSCQKSMVVKKSINCILIALSILILAYYKYFNFISENISEMISLFGFSPNAYTLKLILPLGISFYTLKIVSYIADVQSGKIGVEKNFVSYGLYVSFFPQIVCGPIVKAGQFLNNANALHKYSAADFEAGVKQIIFGFFKKMVIADYLASYVGAVYPSSQTASGLSLACAAFFFSIQIYCDFSGYSDIAIGLARLLGYNTAANFNYPYLAQSFKEFWARWHISLSIWLRDYIYIPLGGNRCSKIRQYLNLMLTFLVSGVWHGANWTYIFWGGLHGIFIVTEKFFSKADIKVSNTVIFV